MTIIIGISGGVASGKNFVSKCFIEFGAKIFDADLEVSKIFSGDNYFYESIQKTFPYCILDNKIDKSLLAERVFEDRNKLKILESIIHPIVSCKVDKFINNCKIQNIPITLLNIPLLFEKESYKKCDLAILVICDLNSRKDRFIRREKVKNKKISDQSLSNKFDNIIINQKTDEEKKKLANAVIYNDSDQEHVIFQIKLILKNYEDNNC
tara:strand:+ start:12860 stop:13486 length:627 start_codon:yes stop_codon:yes gene_type:complete